jgi:hypothetical protein
VERKENDYAGQTRAAIRGFTQYLLTYNQGKRKNSNPEPGTQNPELRTLNPEP